MTWWHRWRRRLSVMLRVHAVGAREIRWVLWPVRVLRVSLRTHVIGMIRVRRRAMRGRGLQWWLTRCWAMGR